MDNLFNATAERAVLGACLLSRKSLLIASSILEPDDFFTVEYYITFKILLEMLTADRAVDFVTFQEEAINQNVYARLGGQPFLAELMSDITTTANVEFHANIVKQYSLRRTLIQTSKKLSALAADPSVEVAEVLSTTEKTIADISFNREQQKAVVPLSKAVENAASKIQDTYKNGISKDAYFSTGFIDLDGILIGFQPGSLNIIAARPSMGKTALALNIAQFGGDMEAPVLIFSLEMTTEQLAFRMLAAQGVLESGPTLTQLQTGTMSDEEVSILQENMNYLAERKIFISDRSALSITDFRVECRRFKQEYKDLALIVVDYLQLMTSGKKDNRQYEIAEISRALKSVAHELNCPVIALSQLSRETEKRVEKRPQLSDLRDSGAIEQDADVVLMLYREDYYSSEATDLDGVAEIKVAKNRNGMTGNCKLTFRREYSRFLNYGTEL